MYKTLGQALLGPMIIMFMTAATALMCITTMESVLWSFLNDIRYGRINTRPDTQRRSYSVPVRASPEWPSGAASGTVRTRLNALCRTE